MVEQVKRKLRDSIRSVRFWEGTDGFRTLGSMHIEGNLKEALGALDALEDGEEKPELPNGCQECGRPIPASESVCSDVCGRMLARREHYREDRQGDTDPRGYYGGLK